MDPLSYLDRISIIFIIVVIPRKLLLLEKIKSGEVSFSFLNFHPLILRQLLPSKAGLSTNHQYVLFSKVASGFNTNLSFYIPVLAPSGIKTKDALEEKNCPSVQEKRPATAGGHKYPFQYIN